MLKETLYVRVRGNVQGPYTPEELRAMAGRGLFSRAHEVSVDRNVWIRASARPDLFPGPNPRANPEEALAREAPLDPEVVLEEVLLEPVALQSSERAANADPPSPGGEWFYTQGTTQRGPVSFSRLDMLVNVGEVSTSDYVWTDGMPQWSMVADRGDLFPNAHRTSYNQSASRTSLIDSKSRADDYEGDEKVSGLAIASLVLGLLGGTFLPVLGSILAVVFGHAALKEIRDNAGRFRGGGMATAGLVMGYFVLAIAVTGIVVLLIVAVATVLSGSN